MNTNSKQTSKPKRTRKSNIPLENQLIKASEELKDLEQLVADKKSQIADIETQIQNKNMKDLYEFVIDSGYSIDNIKSLIENQKFTLT